MSKANLDYWNPYENKCDWLGSQDNLSFTLRTENDLRESALHFHKSLESGMYIFSGTIYHYNTERPSLWSVLKKWWTWKQGAKTTISTELDYRQMIALSDWTNEMMYDPEYQRND